jgi:folylpolyglutamate synthase/dihydropteroate synthase
LLAKYPNQKFVVLLALKAGKDYDQVLQELLPITDRLIITSFETSQDTPIRSQDPHVVFGAAQNFGIAAQIEPNLEAATNLLKQDNSTHKLVTGSFYFLEQARSLI